MTAPETPADTSSTSQEGAEGQDGGSDETLSPEALRAELTRARQDAARYRARAREFADDDQYKRAKDAVKALDKVEQDRKSETERLAEEKEGLLHRATRAEQDLTRLRVSLNAGVPMDRVDEFASRLRGDTEDELEADAKTLVAFFTPARRGDPSQGAGGDDTPSSPEDQFAALIKSKLNAR